MICLVRPEVNILSGTFRKFSALPGEVGAPGTSGRHRGEPAGPGLLPEVLEALPESYIRYRTGMKFAGRESWLVFSGTSYAAETALYLRDALALPVDEPALPPLDPPVPVQVPVPPGVDRAAVVAEWPGWWADVLEWCRSRLAPEPAPEPDLQSLPFMDTSPALAARPALRAALAAVADPAHRYFAAKGPPQLPPSMMTNEVVSELEQELRRPAKPFRFVITEVPVQGEVWLPLTERHVLASTRFMASAAARPALRAAFAALV